MTKLTTKELYTALANQHIKEGISEPWGTKNQHMEVARKLMKKYNISIEDLHKTCGTSEVLDNLKELEKTAYLQGNQFLTSINSVIYIADYEMNLKIF